jgi:uncharacterized membrane protein YheB (UPF0754 family)
MKFQKMEKLINNIIGNEYDHVANEDLKDMKRVNEYKDLAAKVSSLEQELRDILPKDKLNVLSEYYDTITQQLAIEGEYFFQKGVRAGLINLKFLNDIDAGTIL